MKLRSVVSFLTLFCILLLSTNLVIAESSSIPEDYMNALALGIELDEYYIEDSVSSSTSGISRVSFGEGKLVKTGVISSIIHCYATTSTFSGNANLITAEVTTYYNGQQMDSNSTTRYNSNYAMSGYAECYKSSGEADSYHVILYNGERQTARNNLSW